MNWNVPQLWLLKPSSPNVLKLFVKHLKWSSKILKYLIQPNNLNWPVPIYRTVVSVCLLLSNTPNLRYASLYATALTWLSVVASNRLTFTKHWPVPHLFFYYFQAHSPVHVSRFEAVAVSQKTLHPFSNVENVVQMFLIVIIKAKSGYVKVVWSWIFNVQCYILW